VTRAVFNNGLSGARGENEKQNMLCKPAKRKAESVSGRRHVHARFSVGVGVGVGAVYEMPADERTVPAQKRHQISHNSYVGNSDTRAFLLPTHHQPTLVPSKLQSRGRNLAVG
jgi:hypothetical protein